MTEVPLLEIKDLHVGFRSDRKTIVPAVVGASLTVYAGQTVAIVGESGSGKSTTAHAIIDLLPGRGVVTGGQILFEGHEITKTDKDVILALRGSSIGLVPQDPMSNLNPLWKVGSQIKEALVANGVAKGKAADARVVELLEEAGLPDAERRALQYPHEFSGGMRQRALIAMGLAARPKLLIADEPTSALDVTVQKQILDHLDQLTDHLGVAVLFITHDLGLAAERADHLVVMYKGAVVESGPALDVLKSPAAPLHGAAGLVRSLVGLPAAHLGPCRGARAGDPGRDGDGLRAAGRRGARGRGAQCTSSWRRTSRRSSRCAEQRPGSSIDFTAVDDVSFSLRRGTTTAVVGESGSGKSTLARMVLDLLEPTSGRVLFDEVDVRTLKGKKQLQLRRQMQPVFQNPYASLDPQYSIYQSIEEPMRTHDIGTKKEREAKIRDLLDKVSLPTSIMQRFPAELSGGQRQRVAIARALALDPEVVICDEAVSALDVLVQAQILTLLNDLQAELGLSYLFITHDLAVVRQIADDVLVMKEGKVVESASVTQVFDDPQEDYTKKLLDAIPGGSIQLSA